MDAGIGARRGGGGSAPFPSGRPAPRALPHLRWYLQVPPVSARPIARGCTGGGGHI